MSLTWLGHASFRLVLPDGKVIFFDPWFGNPNCPESEKNPTQADLVLISHGHFDHCSSAPQLAKLGAKIACIYEVGEWLHGQGVPGDQIIQMNKGGSLDLGFCKITMVTADHSSGCPGHDEHSVVPGGEAAGWVVRIPHDDGYFAIYHAGDTNVFSDMNIISELYAPKVALLPIGGHFTMGPEEASFALTRFLHSVRVVVPMHFGTFPLLKGTPAELQSHLQARGGAHRVEEFAHGETKNLFALV
eukprot:GILK01001494.1.p1 GENE.GILK01001494.1~~GILK01001494.1.p1  ORF type:complete len:245 (+),score=28.19 GILK01001494.1:43-777(+)